MYLFVVTINISKILSEDFVCDCGHIDGIEITAQTYRVTYRPYKS